jgi:putative protease
VASVEPARAATKHALSVETLRDQLGRLGGTPFDLRGLTAEITGSPMLPFSLLGAVRHDLIAALERAVARSSAPDRRGRERGVIGNDTRGLNVPQPTTTVPTLHILVRSLDQLRRVLELGERRIQVEFADIRHYRDAVDRCRAVGATILLATPRIQKPDELGIFRLMAKQEPDGVLVRNWAALKFFRAAGLPVVGDFSLNVTNERTAEFFMAAGCDRVTASYDCNREQLLTLVDAVPPEWLEVVVHQHMPMFHMEHCVFCAVLSPGTNKTNCGRPCDDHAVKLRDRIGVEHPLTADVGCRNTLYNAVAQSGAEAVPALLAKGVRHLRVELLDEDDAAIGKVIAAYRELMAGVTTGRDVWTALKATNRVGVTRGTLEEKRNPLAIL